MNASCRSCLAALWFLSACGSTQNDASLLTIDDGPLQEHIAQQLINASHQNDALPILLVQGMAGFSAKGRHEYFYGVAQAGHDAGYEVFVAKTDPLQSVAYRARQLAVELDEVLRTTGAPRLHVIAHSQGGLDVRYLISSLGYGDRIKTLVTLGTPHHGVRLVDIALRYAPNHLLEPLSHIINALGDALLGGHADVMAQLHDLSTTVVRDSFNETNLDDERVAYYAYGGYTQANRHLRDRAIDVVTPMLLATHKLTEMCEGDNDGLVSTDSARWGTFLGTLPADHWDEVGQLPRGDHFAFEHLGFYRQLIESLNTSGPPPIF